MASIILHKFIERIRGQFGDIIVKKVHGRSYIARPADRTNVKPPTPAQIDVRQRWTLASAYAKGALQNPVTRAFYDEAAKVQQMPVFATAVGDYLKAPDVGRIDLGAFKGLIGDPVTILATDDVAVVSVEVAIRTASGTLQQGPASNVNGPWVYTATTALPIGQVVTIEVTAKDRAGNAGGNFANFTRTT